MKMRLGVLLILLFISNYSGPVSGVNTTKKFHLITTFKANWLRALHHCLSNNWQLATILSREENDEVVKQIKESGFIDHFWLGGTKGGNDQKFYWMGQKKAFAFTDWLEGEPNNLASEDCIHIWAERNYKWNDWLCSQQLYFVCEEEIEQ